MATKTNVSQLQVTQQRDFKGLSETNNIAKAFLKAPEKVGSIMAYAFGRKHDNVINLLTGGLKNTEYINSSEYEWNLHHQSDKAIEVSLATTGSEIGAGGAPFEITFATKWFDVTDMLVADDGETYIRIMQEPYQAGSSFTYTAQLVSANREESIDPDLVSVGARWSKEWSAVEENSDRGGSHGFSTPYKLRNTLTTLRKSVKVSREAAKTIMVIEMFDPEDPSKKTKLWTKLEEWTAMAHWYRELDASYLYATSTKGQDNTVSLQGSNGRAIVQGAGIRQQIAPANKRFYTSLTYEILDELLLDLSFAAKKGGGDHNFLGLTGMMGMREFNKAMKNYARGNNITVTDNGTFITGSGADLSIDGYFSKVKFMNGISLTMKEFPPYDDVSRNRQVHPISQKPIESYRITIINFGTDGEGGTNICKMALKDSEMSMWTVAGSTDSTGGVANSLGTMRASGVDGYEMHFLSQSGIRIKNPLSCGELILRLV